MCVCLLLLLLFVRSAKFLVNRCCVHVLFCNALTHTFVVEDNLKGTQRRTKKNNNNNMHINCLFVLHVSIICVSFFGSPLSKAKDSIQLIRSECSNVRAIHCTLNGVHFLRLVGVAVAVGAYLKSKTLAMPFLHRMRMKTKDRNNNNKHCAAQALFSMFKCTCTQRH